MAPRDVNSLMQEWGIGEQSRTVQRCVRRTLNLLSSEALLLLRDPRLEVITSRNPRLEVIPPDEDVRAWFPIHPRRRIARLMQPKAETRVLLMLRPRRRRAALSCVPDERPVKLEPWARADLAKLSPKARARRLDDERFRLSDEPHRNPAEVFEEHLRHHLGHVLLYLRTPKALNNCKNAHRVWEEAICARVTERARAGRPFRYPDEVVELLMAQARRHRRAKKRE